MKYCEYCDTWWKNDQEKCGLCNGELQENDAIEKENQKDVKKEVPILGNS